MLNKMHARRGEPARKAGTNRIGRGGKPICARGRPDPGAHTAPHGNDTMRTLQITTHYAGIGSRATPAPVLATMRQIAETLARRGWTLRSGAADGADSAFEAGCDRARGAKEIFLPSDGFRGRHATETGVTVPQRALQARAEALSAKHWDTAKCPWARLRPFTRALMRRNAHQVLGPDLDHPVCAVAYWTPEGAEGGTGQALRIARARAIACIRIEPGSTGAILDALNQARIAAAHAHAR